MIEEVGVFRFGMVLAQAINDKIIIDLYAEIADLFTTGGDPAAEKRQFFTFTNRAFGENALPLPPTPRFSLQASDSSS